MAVRWAVKCVLLAAIVVHLESVSFTYVCGAPVSSPKAINATRKIFNPDSFIATTAAPFKVDSDSETDFAKSLSSFEELLSIIRSGDGFKGNVSQKTNVSNVNIENNRKTELVYDEQTPMRNSTGATKEKLYNNAKNDPSGAKKGNVKQKSVAPTNNAEETKGANAVNSSRQTASRQLSATAAVSTPPSRNKVAPQKPQSIVDAAFTTIPTNKTVGKHSNTSQAVTQRATLNDVMGFLQKFGYLEGRFDNRSEGLYTRETVSQAISDMQRFGGLRPTGVIDNATLELMLTPRCGNKDVDSGEGSEAQGSESRRKKRFVIGAPGWNKRRLTYFLANWSPKIGSEETTLNELKRAFKVWSEYGHLKFVQSPTPDADIVVLFGHGYHGDRYPFDGPGFTLAHAYYPYEYAQLGGDVHFDEDEPWTVAPKDGSSEIDFFTVATHEIGHSLGLAHSPVSGSIMFPYYKGYQSNMHLDYDDILAMYQLYISRHVHDDRDAEGNESEATTTSTTSTTALPPTNTTPARKATTTSSYDIEEDHHRPSKPDETESDWDDKRHWPPPGDDSDEEDDETIVLSSSTTTTTTTTRTINYDGDYESVDDHKRKHNATQDNNSGGGGGGGGDPVPDICQGYFDAVSVMRNELFFFKGQYVWRFRQRMVIDDGYPTHFRYLFRELPHSLAGIDAVYERPDGHIVFFAGDRYWVFNGDRMAEQNMPLNYLGLPDGLERLDAAFVWGKNKKTYFFSKNLYWRYDDVKRQMDPGYPHDLSRWRGVPPDIDAAMQWTDGKTYFFKRNLFWRFDDALVRIDGRYPLLAGPYWFGCPEHE